MKYYLITYEREALKSYKDVHDYFVKHEKIHRWFHYIKSSYIVGTSLTAKELSDHFKTACDLANVKKTHLVIAIDLNDRSGWLPPDAWNWFRKNREN